MRVSKAQIRASVSAQSRQRLNCPITVSLHSVDSPDEQRRPWSECRLSWAFVIVVLLLLLLFCFFIFVCLFFVVVVLLLLFVFFFCCFFFCFFFVFFLFCFFFFVYPFVD